MKLSQCYINLEAEFTNAALGFEITASGMPWVKKQFCPCSLKSDSMNTHRTETSNIQDGTSK